MVFSFFFFFFFQAEDGIRDRDVTGVQTCALPIYDGEGFVDLDAAAVAHDRTALGHLRRLRQAVGFENRISSQPGRRTVFDVAIWSHRRRRSEGIATVHDRRAQLAEPAFPGLHHLCPFLVGLGHAAALVNQYVVRHNAPSHYFECSAETSPCRSVAGSKADCQFAQSRAHATSSLRSEKRVGSRPTSCRTLASR